MKKEILSFQKTLAVIMSTAIIFTMFSVFLRNSISAEESAATDYSNCTYRIEPENYYINSLEGSALRRDYTFLYDDGMNDGDNSELIAMGSYVYTSGNNNGGGKLTYKLPYAVNELLLTGIEAPNDKYNSFWGFEVSSDGENWQTFDMNATYEDKVLSAAAGREVGSIRGVKYYGSTTENFTYFRVEFGRCWLPGINYLYIPKSDAMANCKNKVDPLSLTRSIDIAEATYLRYSKVYTYDGVGGASFNKAGCTVTFTLPYAVDSLSFTAVETYWPNSTREKFHFRNIEVSADGENWSKFTTATGDFEFAAKNVGNGTLNGATYPIHKLGVTYFGTGNTAFRYIRMKSDVAWEPGLCNFYLPDMSCTNRIEPDTYYNAPSGYTTTRYYSSTVMYDDGMNDSDNAEFVAMFPLIFRGSGTEEKKLSYKLPYDVNELLLTGIQSANTASNAKFKTFEVSKDGDTWVNLNMTANAESTVIGADGAVNTAYEGVRYYGSSAESFRYFRVGFGATWCPGINYLYIPESGAKKYCTAKVDPMSLDMKNSSSVKFARFTQTGNANYAHYDGVDGAAFSGSVSGGAALTFNLNKSVTSFAFTAVEIYWPNATRENFRFKSIEVSSDGENWSPFTMSASDFEYVKQKAGSDTVNGKTLPIHWIGVKYFGTSDTPFSYVRLTTKSSAAYQPKLCNFYLPDNYTGVDGDANGDFQVNILDLVRIKEYIADNSVTIYHDADLNGDGKYNGLDLKSIRKLLLK